MTLWTLIRQEIWRRKLHFTMGLFAVVVTVATLLAVVGFLHFFDRQTEILVTAKEKETQDRLSHLQDDFRKIMKNGGYNLMILSKDQNLGDLYMNDLITQDLPEEAAKRLAANKPKTVNHILPMLQSTLVWPETNVRARILGVREELPSGSPEGKSPMIESIPPGSMHLGAELAKATGLHVGSKTTLLGQTFQIEKIYPEKGDREDMTAWINLGEAQTLLKKPGLINRIEALECNCTRDRIPQIREEVCRILPEVQVVEYQNKAAMRAESRNRAAEEAKEAIEQEKTNRAALRVEHLRFANLLIPSLIVACGLWIAILSFSNVRERTPEIGLLRALGFSTPALLFLFLGRALLMGFLGALSGEVVGILVLWGWSGGTQAVADYLQAEQVLFWSVLIGAPLFSALAAWIPALLAAHADPAAALRER